MLTRLLRLCPSLLARRVLHLRPLSSLDSFSRHAGSDDASRFGHRQSQLNSSRAFASEVRAGGSTKHRAAILPAPPSAGGDSSGTSKLIYRSPMTLIKIFRSLALVQTAGCVIGCCSMLWMHNPLTGSGDLKPLALGLSVGFFGIVAARTIGTLVKRHINTLETVGSDSLRVSTLKFPWGQQEHTVSRSEFKAAVSGYDPILLGEGQGGRRLIFVKINDGVFVMSLKSGILDVTACEAALNGSDPQQQQQQQQQQQATATAADVQRSPSPSVK